MYQCEIAALKAQRLGMRRALYAAWYALSELAPCMAVDCKQTQTEAFDDAVFKVTQVLQGYVHEPSR